MLYTLVFLTSLLKQTSQKMEQVIEGKSSLLVERGKFIDDNLNRERISPDEVFGEMHRSGLERLDQVKWAILETDGKISTVPEGNSREPRASKPDDKGPILGCLALY